jgi:hypothetical protein
LIARSVMAEDFVPGGGPSNRRASPMSRLASRGTGDDDETRAGERFCGYLSRCEGQSTAIASAPGRRSGACRLLGPLGGTGCCLSVCSAAPHSAGARLAQSPTDPVHLYRPYSGENGLIARRRYRRRASFCPATPASIRSPAFDRSVSVIQSKDDCRSAKPRATRSKRGSSSHLAATWPRTSHSKVRMARLRWPLADAR